MRRAVLLIVAASLAVPVPLALPAQVGATASTQRALVSGTVVSAAASPLQGVQVGVEDAAGTVLAQTRTDELGAYRLETPPGSLRLVIGSGSLVGQDESLPDRFRWSAELDVTADLTLPVVLPAAHSVTVVTTDGSGRPLAGARVGGTGEKEVTGATLWPGGPVLAGRQQVAPEPVTTDASGRAVLWSFPTDEISAYVEHDAAPGTVARAGLSHAVTGDMTVAAIPGRSACTPREVTDLGPGPVRLVSDLDQVALRDSASGPALLRRADEIVAGTIPGVAYNSARTGDEVRYLYDEGVAMRRVTGILAYAYAARDDTKYLDAMARVAVAAARWPDWNPGHPLDNAQVATAVSLAYGWSRGRMTKAQRAVVADALVTRMVLPYSCVDGQPSAMRAVTGNQSTVIATAAVLAGLAVRNDASAWGSAAVEDGASALARFRLPDGAGRSLASGPTVEGLMYTTYEAASLALLHATAWRSTADPAVTAALRDRLADLDGLAAWTERCGTIADPAVEDGWDFYPWVDRTTALAAIAASPSSGGHVIELLDALQAQDTLWIPDRGTWEAPDGIAELIVSDLSPSLAAPPAVQSYAPVNGNPGSYWGCATNGALRALTGAAPNNAPHGHRDIGNLVVSHGFQPVLADLGQSDYNFVTDYAWRDLTKAHNTLGVAAPDGRVTQAGSGWGSVSATGDGLVMVSANAMRGIDWRRGVSITGTSVAVRDQLRLRTPGTTAPLSMSFLLAAPVENVTDVGGGRFRFVLGDGSTWQLAAPAGVSVALSSAGPTPPYEDSKEFAATLGAAHTLVEMTPTLVDTLDLTTTVTRVGP